LDALAELASAAEETAATAPCGASWGAREEPRRHDESALHDLVLKVNTPNISTDKGRFLASLCKTLGTAYKLRDVLSKLGLFMSRAAMLLKLVERPEGLGDITARLWSSYLTVEQFDNIGFRRKINYIQYILDCVTTYGAADGGTSPPGAVSYEWSWPGFAAACARLYARWRRRSAARPFDRRFGRDSTRPPCPAGYLDAPKVTGEGLRGSRPAKTLSI
jgi:hypothetical protein